MRKNLFITECNKIDICKPQKFQQHPILMIDKRYSLVDHDICDILDFVVYNCFNMILNNFDERSHRYLL